MTRAPIAAWIATWNNCRGIRSFRPLAQGAAAPLGVAAMDDQRQRVDGLAIDQYVHQHEVAGAVLLDLVIEAA